LPWQQNIIESHENLLTIIFFKTESPNQKENAIKSILASKSCGSTFWTCRPASLMVSLTGYICSTADSYD